ncbi:MAG TPA: cyanophycinase [Phycicoccus elongatus]|uniref:cyanophycinase n=1 Tax=Phycicoccus elongatus TaxID=101689 RepID=UPI002BD5B5EB|nr:cyanophycinase [Phycicoccus elongatus]MCB9405596.1 cyanophycinase [Tetrasphaera sp.]HPK12045.1 cyanophycinase [Phycicoccus elongatus]HPQ73155.1 cyanophycinase [Phycicoccus elongatus]
MPARPPRSTLFIIGGAEDKVGRATLLRRFTKLAGGRKAHIVVIPTASSFRSEVVEAYTTVFTRFGASRISVVDPTTRDQADMVEEIAALDTATGVFMSGGNQLVLSQMFANTALGEAIHRAHARGAVIGGTSAGASIMSEFMIALGADGAVPLQRSSGVSQGLGLLKGVVIDQHFAERARYGRLMAVIARSPGLLGIGIDEDTAIEVSDGLFTVHGRSTAFVIDCARAVSDAPDARRYAPLLVSGAVVHALPAGATFDLVGRRLADFVEHHPDAVIVAESAAEEVATARP